MPRILFLLVSSSLLLAALHALVAAPPSAAKPAAAYRLDLEFSPAAALPFLKKFGAIDISVFPRGIRAETLLVEAFTTAASQHVTIENSVARTYSDVPIAEVRRLLLLLSGNKREMFPSLPLLPIEPTVLSGSVRGVKASRYRVRLGKSSWIDVWTTHAIPPNQQLRRLQQEFLTALSRNVAKTASSIPGTPLYVELNTRRFQKVPLLRMKQLVFSREGEAEALKPSPFTFRGDRFSF